MKRAVWKWDVPYEIDFDLQMPIGAEILTAQTQYARTPSEQGVLWALVDPEALLEPRRFKLVGTGHREIPEDTRFVGSIQITNGTLVLHVFEVIS